MKSYGRWMIGTLLSTLALNANAAPVSITVTGTIDSATGTLADILGDTYTASFLIDLDAGAATSIDTDDSDNPLETFTSIYEFYDGNYDWSASVSSGGSAESIYVSVQTDDDLVESGLNNDEPFDKVDIWGSDVTGICPQGVLDTKGYCDETDMDPGEGIEIGLSMYMLSDWFSGHGLPGYIPELNQFLGAGAWGIEFSDGAQVGEFSASVDTMTISSVPVPAAVWLFGSGLIGLIGVARRSLG